MDQIYDVIQALSKEEVRAYKIYAQRQQTKGQRKDLLLFDLIRENGNPANDELFFKKLYHGEDKNAYYRLKNRLLEDINKSMVLLKVQDNEYMLVLHWLQLVNVFTLKNKHPLALIYLKRAEQKAQSIENHELLDIIYGEFIRLSKELLLFDPNDYIEKREQNLKTLNSIRKIDNALAALTYKLKVTQNLGMQQGNLLQEIEHLIKSAAPSADVQNSHRFRIKTFGLVSQALLQSKDYVSLEKYLLEQYSLFEKDKLFKRSNHELRLQMLTYITNTLHKNGKINLSMEYAERLHEAMLEHDGELFERFAIFYYNALVNNYAKTNVNKALEVLNMLLEKDFLTTRPFYSLFVYLNLATCYYETGQFHRALKNINMLYIQDTYKKADPALKFKIAIAELLIRWKLNDADFWILRREQIQKEFMGLSSAGLAERDKLMLQFLFHIHPGAIQSPDVVFLKQVAHNGWLTQPSEEDLIDYTVWINDYLAHQQA